MSSKPNPDPGFDEVLKRDPEILYLNTDIWGGLFISIFGLIGWFGAGEGAFDVWVFPKVNSAIIVLMSIGMVVEGVVRKRVEPIINKKNGLQIVLPMAGGLVLFFFLFTRLGWILTTTLLFGLAILALQPRKTWKAILVSFMLSGGLALFFYYVFGNVFYVPWPEGTWLEPILGS